MKKVKIFLAVRHLLDYLLVMDTTYPATAEEYEEMQSTLKEIAFQDKCSAAAAKWNSKLPLPMVSKEVQRQAYVESMTDYLSRSPENSMN